MSKKTTIFHVSGTTTQVGQSIETGNLLCDDTNGNHYCVHTDLAATDTIASVLDSKLNASSVGRFHEGDFVIGSSGNIEAYSKRWQSFADNTYYDSEADPKVFLDAGNREIKDTDGSATLIDFNTKTANGDWTFAGTISSPTLTTMEDDISTNISDIYNNIYDIHDNTTAIAAITEDTAVDVPGSVGAWTAATGVSTISGSSWRSCAHGNGAYVGVGDAGTYRAMKSTDGNTWTSSTIFSDADVWYDVCYGDGLFVAVGGGGTNYAAYSSDEGATWASSSIATNNWQSVCYGNGKYIAVTNGGADRARFTADPSTGSWTVYTTESPAGTASLGSWLSVCYGEVSGAPLFVAVGYTGTYRIMTSPDGVTWTGRAIDGDDADDTWQEVCYGHVDGNDVFVAIGSGANERIAISNDGITWTRHAVTGDDDTWYSVAFGGGWFIGVGLLGDNRVASSPDGITWTPLSAIGDNDAWSDICYSENAERFVAVGLTYGTPTADHKVMYSDIDVRSKTYYDASDLVTATAAKVTKYDTKSFTPSGTSTTRVANDTFSPVGQTVYMDRDMYLTGASFNMKKVGAPNGRYRYCLWNADGGVFGSTMGRENATPLATTEWYIASGVSTSAADLEHKFTCFPMLSEGTHYAIGVEYHGTDGTPASNNVAILSSTNDEDAGNLWYGLNSTVAHTDLDYKLVSDHSVVTSKGGWKDLIGGIHVRGIGPTDPAWAVYNGAISQYQFAEGDLAWLEFHMPHDYMIGTDMYFHVHWSLNVGSATGDVVWDFDIVYANGHDTAAFTSTPKTFTTGATTVSGTQYQHMITEVQISNQDGSGGLFDSRDLDVDGLFIIRIENDATGTASSDPFVHTADIHYLSCGNNTDNKAPNFND